MRRKSFISWIFAASSVLSACQDPRQVDRRGKAEAIKSADANANFDIDPVTTELAVTPSLVEVKNSGAITAAFRANVGLISKVAADGIMIYGKDGRSWLYNSAIDQAPKPVDAVVAKPEGFSLYTLPDGNFWLMGPGVLGRRKPGVVASGAVTVENFSTSAITGDWTKARVLFASSDTFIVFLETHLAILKVEGALTGLTLLSSKLPVALAGPILTAGKTTAGGYWFGSRQEFAAVEWQGLKPVWSKLTLLWAGHEDYDQLGMWLNLEKRAVDGDALVTQADRFWSVTGAPVQ